MDKEKVISVIVMVTISVKEATIITRKLDFVQISEKCTIHTRTSTFAHHLHIAPQQTFLPKDF